MGSRQRKPRSTWLGRLVRGRRLDRNPLRRRSDRAETAVLAVLAAAFLAGAPVAALATGAWETAAAHREQVAQEAERYRVPAVVLETADLPTVAGGSIAEPEAEARWTAPDGATIASQIPVVSGTQAGTTVRIWVTREGAITQPPMLDSQVKGQVSLAETGAVAALAVTLAVVGAAARKVLDRRRIAAWEAEWRAAGPRWTTRT